MKGENELKKRKEKGKGYDRLVGAIERAKRDGAKGSEREGDTSRKARDILVCLSDADHLIERESPVRHHNCDVSSHVPYRP